MLEADNLSQTHRVYGGYAQSKWAAEVLLRECPQLKRFTRYFRLGLLTTDTESGGFATHDLLTLTIKGVLELGCVPDCSERLRMDVTPVNYAADVLSRIFSRRTEQSVFHVAHPDGLMAKALFEALQQLHSEIQVVSKEEFLHRVQSAGITSQSAAACLALCREIAPCADDSLRQLNLFQATDARFDMSNTSEVLRGTNLEPPALDNAFVERMIRPMLQGEMAGYCEK